MAKYWRENVNMRTAEKTSSTEYDSAFILILLQLLYHKTR